MTSAGGRLQKILGTVRDAYGTRRMALIACFVAACWSRAGSRTGCHVLTQLIGEVIGRIFVKDSIG